MLATEESPGEDIALVVMDQNNLEDPIEFQDAGEPEITKDVQNNASGKYKIEVENLDDITKFVVYLDGKEIYLDKYQGQTHFNVIDNKELIEHGIKENGIYHVKLKTKKEPIKLTRKSLEHIQKEQIQEYQDLQNSLSMANDKLENLKRIGNVIG